MPPQKEKAGKGGTIPPVAHRFTKDNQPSGAAKSEGLKEYWSREHLRDRFSEVFAEEIELAGGGRIVGYRALAKRLLKYFLGDGQDQKKLSDKQVANALKLLDILAPSENKINFVDDLKIKVANSSLKVENAETVKDAIREVFNECFGTSVSDKK